MNPLILSFYYPALPNLCDLLLKILKVDASDLPFRLMCIKGGATTTYTQMYTPEKLKLAEEYRRRALQDLAYERELPNELRRPVIVQLGGRDIGEMVEAAQLFAPLCDGIGPSINQETPEYSRTELCV